jgi:HPt (histidine-containing phosphotransfer) domain-containing protein
MGNTERRQTFETLALPDSHMNISEYDTSVEKASHRIDDLELTPTDVEKLTKEQRDELQDLFNRSKFKERYDVLVIQEEILFKEYDELRMCFDGLAMRFEDHFKQRDELSEQRKRLQKEVDKTRMWIKKKVSVMNIQK